MLNCNKFKQISTSARTVTLATETQLAPTPTVASTALAWTGTLEPVFQETAKVTNTKDFFFEYIITATVITI